MYVSNKLELKFVKKELILNGYIDYFVVVVALVIH